MTVEILIVAFVASVVAIFFLNIAMISISRDFSKLRKRVSELETLVDYIYELRHILTNLDKWKDDKNDISFMG